MGVGLFWERFWDPKVKNNCTNFGVEIRVRICNDFFVILDRFLEPKGSCREELLCQSWHVYAESGFLNQDFHTWLGLCITEPFGRNFEKIHIQMNFVFQFCFVSFWIWFVGAFSRFRPNVHWLPELAANRVPTSLQFSMQFGSV